MALSCFVQSTGPDLLCITGDKTSGKGVNGWSEGATLAMGFVWSFVGMEDDGGARHGGVAHRLYAKFTPTRLASWKNIQLTKLEEQLTSRSQLVVVEFNTFVLASVKLPQLPKAGHPEYVRRRDLHEAAMSALHKQFISIKQGWTEEREQFKRWCWSATGA